MLQGFIYSMFDKKEYGDFLHNHGYRIDNKIFKMFVFSNLFGKYHIEKNNTILFEEYCRFYISSQSAECIQYIYSFLTENSYIILNGNKVKIESIQIIDVPYFKGERDILIKTLSPVVTYTTIGKKVLYYKPSDSEFNQFCYSNLLEKNGALDNPISSLVFSVEEVLFEKKRLVHFKNTFYIAYLSELKIHTNYETLTLLYNTGLSSKGSAGFGMIEAKI